MRVLLLAFLAVATALAQPLPDPPLAAPRAVIEGRVVDAALGRPLAGVHVFLAYSLRGEATDDRGRYHVPNVRPGVYQLVASRVGYEPHVQAVTVGAADTLTVDVALRPAVIEMDEVEVTARDSDEWRRDLERFKALFFGSGEHAAEATLVNPYVLDFATDGATGRFSAEASEPLIIHNRALGYRVTFLMQEFWFDPDLGRLRYAGLPTFTPFAPADSAEAARWTLARQRAFLGSPAHLSLALVMDRLEQEGFELQLERRQEPPRAYNGQVFEEVGRLDQWPVERADVLFPTEQVPPLVLNTRGHLHTVPDLRDSPFPYQLHFPGYLRVAYTGQDNGLDRPYLLWRGVPRTLVSWIELEQPPVGVAADGALPVPELLTYGALGDFRIVDHVPREFGPTLLQVDLAGGPPPFAADQEGTGRGGLGTGLEDGLAVQPLGYTHYIIDGAPDGLIAEAQALLEAHDWPAALRPLRRRLQGHPDDAQTHYLLGIAHRELRRLVPGVGHANQAVEHFEAVLARDSSYRDVLFQYALLERYREDFEEAIRLGEAQVERRPKLRHAQRGLHALYRPYVYEADPEEAVQRLAAVGTHTATLYRAEALRRWGKLESAEAVLHGLLACEDHQMPRPPLHLALALVRSAQGRAADAEAAVRDAIAAIDTPLGADLLFDDAKYVIHPDELEAYRALADAGTPADYRDFFRRFWAARDPVPSTPTNERIVEHLRRVRYAEAEYLYTRPRSWMVEPNNNPARFRGVGDPDTEEQRGGYQGAIDYPPAYGLNELYNDKGLIYLRFGDPDERAFANGTDTPERQGYWTGGGALSLSGSVPNESWRYHTPELLDFHFTVEEGGGGNWRLVPIFPINAAGASARQDWGGVYLSLAQDFLRTGADRGIGPSGAFPGAVERMAQTFRAQAERGLRTDRHAWPREMEPIETPHVAAAFRGPGDQVAIEVHYLIPSSEIVDGMGRERRASLRAGRGLPVEVGLTLEDGAYRMVAQQTHTMRLPVPEGDDVYHGGAFSLTAPPDSYRVSFHARPVGAPLLGGAVYGRRLDDFHAGGLAMSDLLPAFEATPLAEEPQRRSDVDVRVNPSLVFDRADGLHLYFEVYNLLPDLDGRTRYTLEYRLAATEEPGRLGRLLGRGEDDALAVRAARMGARRDALEAVELDVQDVAKGSYRLTVTVTDEHAEGVSVARTIPVVLR